MKLTQVVLGIVLAVSAVKLSAAQEQNIWIPQGIGILQHSAASKSEFTFDHSMLVLASKLEPGDEDLRRVIAGVSGISVHRFHFPGEWQYDPGALSAVSEEYKAAGWKQVVNKRDKSDEGGGTTSVWVRMDNNAVSNVALLLARAHDVNFVVVSGSISPIDLSHLGGHFGIPRIEGGVRVPNRSPNGAPNGTPNNERGQDEGDPRGNQ
jgi:hypothetical protein